MKVTVIGTGYVGLVSGTCLADIGNHVVCLDVDADKVALLNGGGVPIYEPGLAELIARNRAASRLAFTTDAAEAVAHADVVFIAVGTPPGEDGSADLRHVLGAADSVGRHLEGFTVVVNKSTVPVGTGEQVHAAVCRALEARGLDPAGQFAVASNPEFLKEGAAIEDFMRPDRIVIGTPPGSAGDHAREVLRELYAPFNRNHDRILCMDLRAAEFTKYAANAMLATRISFMNELANLASHLGVDIEQVRKGIGSDPRIGYSFLYAGTGYGGSCFPKDVQALRSMGAQHGEPLRVLAAVEAVNETQKALLARKVVGRFGEDLRGRRFAIWGLAFKPKTDDMREAPSRIVMRDLLQRGAALAVFDPVAMTECRRVLEADLAGLPGALGRVTFCQNQMDAVDGADALVVVTEWSAFKSPDFEALRQRLKTPVIFDGRNLYDPAIRRQGFEYHAIGR